MAEESTNSAPVGLSMMPMSMHPMDVEKGFDNAEDGEPTLIPHTAEYEQKHGIYWQGTCYDRNEVTTSEWEIKDLYVSISHSNEVH